MSAGDESPEETLPRKAGLHRLPLSPWLKLMLAEIAHKRADLDQARAEELQRAAEADRTSPRASGRGPPV